MGEHIDNRKNSVKRHKKGFRENIDPALARQRRVTFKNYLRDVKEELLESDLEDADDNLDE